MNNKRLIRRKPAGFENKILKDGGISGQELIAGSKMMLNGKEVVVVKQRPLKHFTTVYDSEKEFEVDTDKLERIEIPFSNYYLGNFINTDFPMYIIGLLEDGIICRNDIEQAKTYNIKYDKIIRIPITEDWLKKLKMIPDKTISNSNFYRLNDFLICSIDNEEFYYCKDYDTKLQRLIFVDELQNELNSSNRIMTFDELPLDVKDMIQRVKNEIKE